MIRKLIIGLAVSGAAVGWASAVGPDGDLASARQRLEQMDAAAKERLRRKQEQFGKLDAAERDRIRKLHAAIQAHPRRDELVRVMNRYHDWIKTLPPFERAELRELAIEPRVKKIKELQQKQQAEEQQRLASQISKQDQQAVERWMQAYAQRHESDVLARLPKEPREWHSKLPAEDKTKNLTRMAWETVFRPPHWKLPEKWDEEYPALVAALSSDTRKVLEGAKTPELRERIVKGWVSMVLWGFGRRGGWNRPAIPREELEKLLSQLDAAQRDKLLSKPRDEMEHELRRMYFDRARRGFGGPPGPPPPGPNREGGRRDRGDREKGDKAG